MIYISMGVILISFLKGDRTLSLLGVGGMCREGPVNYITGSTYCGYRRDLSEMPRLDSAVLGKGKKNPEGSLRDFQNVLHELR
jgi:hypothetical protein